MKAKKFKHQNVVYAENQPEYTPLPALKIKSKQGEVVFCMGLSFYERVRVLIFGEIWVSLTMFGQPLTPSFHATNKKEVYYHPDFETNQFRRFIDLGAILYFKP